MERRPTKFSPWPLPIRWAEVVSELHRALTFLCLGAGGRAVGRAPRAAQLRTVAGAPTLTCVSYRSQHRAGHIAHKRRPKAEEVGVQVPAMGALTV